MQAAWYRDFGPAAAVLQIGEQATPEPAAGEVRVRMVASGVNPVDVKRRGGGRGAMPSDLVVPQFDGAGVIDKVGAGVDVGRVGSAVWVYEAMWQRVLGTGAEYVALPERCVVPLPDGADFATGACYGIPAMTAHRCVFADGSVDGQTVLVTGGAGAVGAYGVQFAALGGATVIATVSGPEKAALAQGFGAAHMLNYREEDVAHRIAEITDGAGVDRVVEVEFGGNLETSVKVLKENGVIAAYASDAAKDPAVPFYALAYKNVTVRHVLVFNMPEAAKQHAIADIARWTESGALKSHIGPHFALADIVQAHEAVEQGALGNVIVDLPYDGS